MDARTKGTSAWSADIRITICTLVSTSLCNSSVPFPFQFLSYFFFFFFFYGRTTSKIPLKFILFLHVEVSVMVPFFSSLSPCVSPMFKSRVMPFMGGRFSGLALHSNSSLSRQLELSDNTSSHFDTYGFNSMIRYNTYFPTRVLSASTKAVHHKFITTVEPNKHPFERLQFS